MTETAPTPVTFTLESLQSAKDSGFGTSLDFLFSEEPIVYGAPLEPDPVIPEPTVLAPIQPRVRAPQESWQEMFQSSKPIEQTRGQKLLDEVTGILHNGLFSTREQNDLIDHVIGDYPGRDLMLEYVQEKRKLMDMELKLREDQLAQEIRLTQAKPQKKLTDIEKHKTAVRAQLAEIAANRHNRVK